MYQCIAVETGKLTNYFILYLTVDPINIILGFSRSKGPNIMYQPNWSFNILPPPPPGIWTFDDWLVQIPPLGAKKPFKCPTN